VEFRIFNAPPSKAERAALKKQLEQDRAFAAGEDMNPEEEEGDEDEEVAIFNSYGL
jgi:hypothetical protein